jgi:hypothetical protein
MQQNQSASQRRRSLDEIKAILVAYHSSGLSQREFAQKRAIPLATLSNWLRRERKNGKPAKEKSAKIADPRQKFIPVQLSQTPAVAGVLELALPEGMVLRIPGDFSAAHLKKLLVVLRSC